MVSLRDRRELQALFFIVPQWFDAKAQRRRDAKVGGEFNGRRPRDRMENGEGLRAMNGASPQLLHGGTKSAGGEKLFLHFSPVVFGFVHERAVVIGDC
jgi:hypothetical protein